MQVETDQIYQIYGTYEALHDTVYENASFERRIISYRDLKRPNGVVMSAGACHIINVVGIV